jgi:hypothetical protein
MAISLIEPVFLCFSRGLSRAIRLQDHFSALAGAQQLRCLMETI